MSKAIDGFWTALEVRAPERNRPPAPATSARNRNAAVAMSRNIIGPLPLGVSIFPGRQGGTNRPVLAANLCLALRTCGRVSSSLTGECDVSFEVLASGKQF